MAELNQPDGDKVAELPDSCLCIDPTEVEPFDRLGGVITIPYVGKWNSQVAAFTTGVTKFAVGASLPLHSHNVEESVLVLAGDATAQIGEATLELVTGQATWVAAGVQHRFWNRGDTEMSIYWIYGGRDVTRTMASTGETFEHLSPRDRGGSDS